MNLLRNAVNQFLSLIIFLEFQPDFRFGNLFHMLTERLQTGRICLHHSPVIDIDRVDRRCRHRHINGAARLVDIKLNLRKIDAGMKCTDIGELNLLGRKRNGIPEQLAVFGDIAAVNIARGCGYKIAAGLDQLSVSTVRAT